MEIVANVAAYAALFYAVGCVLFVSYAALELSSFHKQHEVSRDKNLKNALTAIAKEQISEIKTFWKWPLYVALAIKSAIIWAKSL